jgi:hypothetical protein
MTQTEQNKLIAEFMGYKFHKNHILNDVKGVYKKKNYMPMLPTDFSYHSNWSWLMPVVEKIAKLETTEIIHNGEDSYFDSYYPRTFAMVNAETKDFMVRINRFSLHQSNSLIEATYQAVIQFVEWYNLTTLNKDK